MNLLDSYQTYFRDLWPILRDMSARGIPIDNSRRLELKSLIDREDLRVTAEIQSIVPSELRTMKQKNGYKNPPILPCADCDYKGRGDHPCIEGTVVLFSELAEFHGLVQRTVTLTAPEKCRCTKKTRSACAVCAGLGVIPAGVEESRWATPVEFNPNSSQQVKGLIRYLKHPQPKHAKRTDSVTGEAADTTEVKELERLAAKTKHPIYNLLIQKRQLTKMEGTYYEGWRPASDGYVHPTFTYQTSIWQLSAKAPNSQNGIKHADPDKYPLKAAMAEAFNRMQRAKVGHVLVNFDWKSFFPITMSHDFNMPRYCRLARLDIHSFVTCYFLQLPERQGLWERDDADMIDLFKYLKKDSRFKFTRDYKSKRVILGMGNGLFYRKMYQVHREDFENEGEAKKLYDTVIAQLFPRLQIGQTAVKKKAAEEGRLINKFGAIRHFYDVQRWDRKQQKMVAGRSGGGGGGVSAGLARVWAISGEAAGNPARRG